VNPYKERKQQQAITRKARQKVREKGWIKSSKRRPETKATSVVVTVLLAILTIVSCASTRHASHVYGQTKDTFLACADTRTNAHIRAFQSLPTYMTHETVDRVTGARSAIGRLELLTCGQAYQDFISTPDIIIARMCCSYRYPISKKHRVSWLTGIYHKNNRVEVIEHSSSEQEYLP
jgi:hypothetical protein